MAHRWAIVLLIYGTNIQCALVHISPINEALVPPIHPNVVHVLDISKTLVPSTYLNALFFLICTHGSYIYPRVTLPDVRHLGTASELHYIYGSLKSPKAPLVSYKGHTMSNVLTKYVREHIGDMCPIYGLIYEPHFVHGSSNILAILGIFTRAFRMVFVFKSKLAFFGSRL